MRSGGRRKRLIARLLPLSSAYFEGIFFEEFSQPVIRALVTLLVALLASCAQGSTTTDSFSSVI
jgi:hypothetical protein